MQFFCFKVIVTWGAEMASAESAHLPPAWPGLKSQVLYMSWVCCWFSSLLRGFFAGFSVGVPPKCTTKTNISKCQFYLGTVGQEPLGQGYATTNFYKFFILFHFFKFYCFSLLCVQVEYDEFNSLSVLKTGGDPLIIPLPNADIPLQVFTTTTLNSYYNIEGLPNG